MAIDDSKMITFYDMQYLIDNENFEVKNNFTSSLECAIKLEIDDSLYINQTAEWVAWASDRLVPRRLLVPESITWEGAGAVCIDSEDPNPGVVTAPTLVVTGKNATQAFLSWNASPGSTPNGTIVNYEIEYLTSVGSNPSWQVISPQLSGGTKTYTFNGNTLTEYTFRVRLIDSTSVSSSWSNEVTVYLADNTAPSNPLILSIEQNTGLLVYGRGTEVKVIGSQNSEIHFKIEVLSGTGSYNIRVGGSLGHQVIDESTVNGGYTYYWLPTGLQTTLTANQSGGYYFTYPIAVYFESPNNIDTVRVRVSIVSATDYPENELPSPIIIDVDNNTSWS